MKRNTETASVAKKYRKRGAMGEILHRLRKNKGAMAGAVILLLLFAVALTIDFWLDKELVIGQNLRARLKAPSAEHWFGTDEMGRDLFWRIMYGSRFSLSIGFVAVFVSLIIGGRSKSSIHRPEMCLPSQGFQMTDPRDVQVGGVEWRLMTLARKTSAPLGFAYTFFNQDGFRTSSHLRRIMCDVCDRSLRRRIDRWAMVTVNSSTADYVRMANFLELLKGVVK